MIWDTHMHTSFSGDSDASPESMAENAVLRGLEGICITDHLDIDYPDNPDLFLLDTDAYEPAIRRLQESFHNKLPIRFGIELGLQPHLAQTHHDILAAHDFDFVIGSSHVVHGADPYFPAYYEGRDEQDAYLEYFLSIPENIRAFDEFDVYGHIDYVVRYGPNKNRNYTYRKYSDIIDESLKLLISRGKGIEVNTGGFRYGLGHPNPTEDILKRYRELGGEIITVGADAPAPEDIAFDFEKIPDILKTCGFRYYTIFRNRRPEFIKL